MMYLCVIIVRYAVRMSLYPLERWTGGSIPIFFHWVLAAYLLVLGFHHRRSSLKLMPQEHLVTYLARAQSGSGGDCRGDHARAVWAMSGIIAWTFYIAGAHPFGQHSDWACVVRSLPSESIATCG